MPDPIDGLTEHQKLWLRAMRPELLQEIDGSIIRLPKFVLDDEPASEAIVAALQEVDGSALRAILADGVTNDALRTLLTSLALHFDGQTAESLQSLDTVYPDSAWEGVALVLHAAFCVDQMDLSASLQAINKAYRAVTENPGPRRAYMLTLIGEYTTLIDRLAAKTVSPLRSSRKLRRAGPTSYVVSYPRSGNTMVMSALRYIFDAPAHSVFHGDSCFFSRELYDPSDSSVIFIKEHIYKGEYIKDRAVYIVRDGRDSMASLCRFLSTPEEFQAMDSKTFGDFLTSAAQSYIFGFWSDNVRLAVEAQDAGADVMILRYEDLRRDADEYFRIASYIAANRIVGRDPAAMKSYVEQEKSWLLNHPEWGFESTSAPELFSQWTQNRGESNWRTVFNDRARRIFHELGGTDMLLRFGYETDPDWWKKD